MRIVSRKPIHIALSILLWSLAILFIVSSLGALATSLAASFFFAVLGLVCLPPTWQRIRNIQPKIFNKKLRSALIIGLFILAGINLPPSTEASDTTVVAQVPVIKEEVSSQPATSQKDQPQKLTRISYSDGTYSLAGSGLANTTYTLKPTESQSFTAKTDNNGIFTITIPSTTQVFGTILLTRDTNGGWPGGEETYDTQYFTLNEKSTLLQTTSLEPIVFGLTKTAPYEVSGYFTPKKTLVLKSHDKTLSTVKVDSSGRYAFKNIDLTDNYTEVTIYEKISTGWFSSKEQTLNKRNFLDKNQSSIITELPITTRDVVVTNPIAYSSRDVQSYQFDKGTSQVTQNGVNGEQKRTYKVTYSGDKETKRELVRDEIAKQPIERITTIGTRVIYTPPAPAPAPKPSAPQTPSGGRTGATCRDGTHSNATGRGACSHHGGVATWLY